MTLLAAAPRARATLLAAGLLATLALDARAQLQLTHTEDASPVPVGMLRLQVVNGWTRYDQRFTSGGTSDLDAPLSADPLGTTQFPLLAPLERSLQALAGNTSRPLSLGRLVTRGDARIVVTPIALQLGLTRRLSVGIVVPVVQTRHSVSLDVNSVTGAPANVGFVPASLRDAAASANSAAASSYAAAARQLTSLIASCQTSPGNANCAAVNADPAGAAALATLAQKYSAAASALGTSSADALIAPRANGLFALDIELQRNSLNRLLQQYIGAGATQALPVFFAPTNFSYIDLQGRDGTMGLLQSPLAGGLDSIRTTERIGIGDISVGAQLQVFDGFQRDTLPLRRFQSRLAVGASVRFATGRADTVTNLVDIGTREGAAVELRSAYDVIVGRVGGTVAGRYVKSFPRMVQAPLYGDPESGFPLPGFGLRDRTSGDVVGLDVTPRYLLSETFALDAHYGLERRGATTDNGAAALTPRPDFCAFVDCDGPAASARTAQRIGVGFRYSTVDAYARGRTHFPVEASFTHLTTFSGDPGVPKLSREQVQLRLFYRLFGQ